MKLGMYVTDGMFSVWKNNFFLTHFCGKPQCVTSIGRLFKKILRKQMGETYQIRASCAHWSLSTNWISNIVLAQNASGCLSPMKYFPSREIFHRRLKASNLFFDAIYILWKRGTKLNIYLTITTAFAMCRSPHPLQRLNISLFNLQNVACQNSSNFESHVE